MGTAYFHYKTAEGVPSNIKIQVNFVEPLFFDTVGRDAHSLVTIKEPVAAEALEGPGLAAYREKFPARCYDPKEVAAEKARAILTRRTAKVRDVIDLFLLDRELGVVVKDLEAEIQEKIAFATRLGEKYRANLETAPSRFRALAQIETHPLLLRPIEQPAFEKYREDTLFFLADLMRDLQSDKS